MTRGTSSFASASASIRLTASSVSSAIASALSMTAFRRSRGQARGSVFKYTTIASKSSSLSKSTAASFRKDIQMRMMSDGERCARRQSMTRPLNRTGKSEAKADMNHPDAYNTGATSCFSKCCASVAFFTRSTTASWRRRIFKPSMERRYIERKSLPSMSVTNAANARFSDRYIRSTPATKAMP